MDLAGRLMGGIKNAVGSGFNLLPDRINLFGRYLTGFGNPNLQLDRSTEKALIRATERPPFAMQERPVWDTMEAAMMGDPKESRIGLVPVEAQGPGIPTSGPVISYGLGDKDSSQTLGSFNAEVTPTTVRVRDTYDMENRSEDPDLVSGKFQPDKAFNTLRGAFQPGIDYNPFINKIVDNSHLLTPEEKSFQGYLKQKGRSDTFSPMTDVARSLMYALPIKFKPYEIDYTIQR